MVLGIVAAEVAPRLPVIALGFPALMLINATFFHVGPFLVMKGRFSPGLLSAVFLFYPLGIASFRIPHLAVTIGARGTFEAFLIGTLLMAAPIVFVKLKNKPYFQQRPNG